MDFLTEYKDYLFLLGLHFIISGVYIYMPTQAIVYIFGRMLEIYNSNKSRNTIALITTILFTVGYLYFKKEHQTPYEYLWAFFHWFSISILWYVLLGFKLASKIDSFLDKKIGKGKSGKK